MTGLLIWGFALPLGLVPAGPFSPVGVWVAALPIFTALLFHS